MGKVLKTKTKWIRKKVKLVKDFIVNCLIWMYSKVNLNKMDFYWYTDFIQKMFLLFNH